METLPCVEVGLSRGGGGGKASGFKDEITGLCWC